MPPRAHEASAAGIRCSQTGPQNGQRHGSPTSAREVAPGNQQLSNPSGERRHRPKSRQISPGDADATAHRIALSQAKRPLQRCQRQPKAVANDQGSANGRTDDARDLRKHAFAESQDLDVVHFVLADLFTCSLYLCRRGGALHQNEFATVTQ